LKGSGGGVVRAEIARRDLVVHPLHVAAARRRLHEVQTDQEALRQSQVEFEKFLVAAPALTWPEAAAKARYVIQLYAATLEAQDERRRTLIASVLADLTRLAE